MNKRAKNLAYVATQLPAAAPIAETGGGEAPPRALQNRWPVAISILGAVAASLAMWVAIVWIVSLFMGLFA